MQDVVVVVQMVKTFESAEVCVGLTWLDAISIGKLANERYHIAYGVMIFS